MKGFIEVNCYSDWSRYNNVNTVKYLFPISKIALCNSFILFNGNKYSCTKSYEEIKQLIIEAQK